MDRFEDISDDFALMRALEDLQEVGKAAKATHEKNKILRASLNQLGVSAIMNVQAADGAYSYIPIDLDEFFDMLFTLETCLKDDPDYRHSEKPHRPLSFVEVGCGHGRNLHLLRSTDRFCMDKIVGFDIALEYIEAGRRYFDLEEDIFVGDAFEFDYGGFDVIYFYRPFSDSTKQKKFEKRVISTMKSGAYIVSSLNEALDKSRQLVPKDERGRIWKRL